MTVMTIDNSFNYKTPTLLNACFYKEINTSHPPSVRCSTSATQRRDTRLPTACGKSTRLPTACGKSTRLPASASLRGCFLSLNDNDIAVKSEEDDF